MNTHQFLQQLSTHVEAGRLDGDTFQRIADHEAKNPSSSPQATVGFTDDVLEDEGGNASFIESGKRFSLALLLLLERPSSWLVSGSSGRSSMTCLTGMSLEFCTDCWLL